MQILILANHSGGLYDFRKDLISELKSMPVSQLLFRTMTAGTSFCIWLTA